MHVCVCAYGELSPTSIVNYVYYYFNSMTKIIKPTINYDYIMAALE